MAKGIMNTPLRAVFAPVLCLLLSVAASSAFIVSSSNSVRTFTQLDLSSNLKKFIEHEEIRLKVIKDFKGHEDEVPLVEKRLEEFKVIEKQLKENETAATDFLASVRANHPTTIFAAIRNFESTWGTKFANTTLYGKRFREFIDTKDVRPLPDTLDLHRSGMAISVIQEVYNMSMEELTQGKVGGQQGEPLSPADCYDIGQTMLRDGLLDGASEWISFAVSSVDLENKESFTFNVSNALATLAKLAFQQKKDQDKALELFEKATELDPDNIELYRDYVKHRSGRNVTPMPEMETEKVEDWRKKYFEMCKNSTGISVYDIKNKTNPRLRCRYKSSAVTPYLVYREEILSVTPYISILYNFVSDAEVEAAKNASLDSDSLKEFILPGNDRATLWQYKGTFFRDDESPAFANISQKCGDVTGLDVSQRKTIHGHSMGEPVHVIDFGVGGLALPHADNKKIYHASYMGIVNGNRYASVYIQLTDIAAGGATVFIEQNITVVPRKGMAVLIYNYNPAGVPEDNLYVGTCPLAVGENIVLEKGIWHTIFDKTHFCGKKPKSTRFAMERVQALSQARAAADKPAIKIVGGSGEERQKEEPKGKTGEEEKTEVRSEEKKEEKEEVKEKEKVEEKIEEREEVEETIEEKVVSEEVEVPTEEVVIMEEALPQEQEQEEEKAAEREESAEKIEVEVVTEESEKESGEVKEEKKEEAAAPSQDESEKKEEKKGEEEPVKEESSEKEGETKSEETEVPSKDEKSEEKGKEEEAEKAGEALKETETKKEEAKVEKKSEGGEKGKEQAGEEGDAEEEEEAGEGEKEAEEDEDEGEETQE
ncbi:prolyl 4-hydroxylase subunit alpha-1 [Aplysia californica]|uniref:Prolyl 4-hydroxylase subunit alpha-1 n=1 Tax=Aplysia californica TaxID=6500 RepID=A0ABM0ZYQ9_APLCA|nr:prolyl 4-hydroxylase subunit alpha-1 [Aplysia californica]